MKNGYPIRDSGLPKRLDVGIDIRVTDPGIVPLYESMEACRFGGYTWVQWYNDLDWNDRAQAVAHYRMHNLIESHISAEGTKTNGIKNRSRANRR